jgi:LysM repeat protein
VEGKSLAKVLEERGGPIPEAEALPWIRQVCDALSYLHARQPPIIHRDIKPENIIITAQGRAMLVDFGISKAYDPSKGTTIGAKAVTPGYSPPEQYGRGRTDARSDVYSLAATLYTLLTGQVPPEAPDLSSGAETLTPPRRLNPTVSEETSRAIVEGMMLSISQRLGDVGRFERSLASAPPPAPPLQRTLPAPPLPPTATAVAPVVPRGSAAPPVNHDDARIWGWLVVVAVVIALAVWAAMSFRGQNGDGTTGLETATVVIQAEGATDETLMLMTQVARTPVPAATSAPRTTVQEPGDATGIHTVQAGETINSISQLYGVSVEDIVAANGLTNPDELTRGTMLVIPIADLPTPTRAAPVATRAVSIAHTAVPEGQIFAPGAIAVDGDGNFYVVDVPSHRIQRFTADGEFIAWWGGEGSTEGQFIYPEGIAVASDGTVYVADRGNHRIQHFTADGTFINQWGSEGSGEGQFDAPEGIAVGGDGTV